MSILRREEKEMWRQRQRLESCVVKTGVASSYLKLGGRHGTYCPAEPQWGPSHGHVDFGLLAFRPMRESSSVAWSYRIGGNLLQQLQETNTDDNGCVLWQSWGHPAWACCSLVTGKSIPLGSPQNYWVTSAMEAHSAQRLPGYHFPRRMLSGFNNKTCQSLQNNIV